MLTKIFWFKTYKVLNNYFNPYFKILSKYLVELVANISTYVLTLVCLVATACTKTGQHVLKHDYSNLCKLILQGGRKPLIYPRRHGLQDRVHLWQNVSLSQSTHTLTHPFAYYCQFSPTAILFGLEKETEEPVANPWDIRKTCKLHTQG